MKEWFYSKSGTQLGPGTEQELSERVQSSEVSASDLVWRVENQESGGDVPTSILSFSTAKLMMICSFVFSGLKGLILSGIFIFWLVENF